MKKQLLILLLVFISPRNLIGQTVNDSLLTNFYNEILVKNFIEITKDQKKFGIILIKTDFDKTKLVKNVGLNKFTFLSFKESERSYFIKPFKENNGRQIYHISHKLIAKDTVDINLNSWSVENVTRKHANLLSQCGGTLGYIPTARFIYYYGNNKWKYIP